MLSAVCRVDDMSAFGALSVCLCAYTVCNKTSQCDYLAATWCIGNTSVQLQTTLQCL